jgi:hypothetical protein
VSPDITRQINRDTLTVMGRRWPDDAVWKNVYTNQISIGIALDESPLVEGLLYTGSDDGVVSVSEDGGQNWRTIERFPGVPEGTWVSELLASRFDANTVYAAFNGQWLGDFAPYLLKSSDRGRTWASISANLPEGNQVWTLAQDHVTADLIFAGTEHGVYVTRNGGQSWDRLRSGLPHIPVRDIEIQRRENDLVLGTFGRGIYILDDYSAFRTLRAQAMQQAGTLFAPRAAKLYNPVSYERGGSANGIFVGENPPFGAILTYHIGVGPAAGTEILLAVSDAGGQVVRELPAEAAVGTHRVVWNLRAVPPSAAGGRGGAVGRAGGRGGRGGRGGGRGGRGGGGTGPLVPAGTYTVQLQSRAGGQTTNLGGAQRLEVRALDR